MKKLLPITIVLAGLVLVTFMFAKKKPAEIQKVDPTAAPQSEPMADGAAQSQGTGTVVGSGHAPLGAKAHPTQATQPNGETSTPTAPIAKLEPPHCYRAVFKHKVIESHND